MRQKVTDAKKPLFRTYVRKKRIAGSGCVGRGF
jgi:hypothetical protein